VVKVLFMGEVLTRGSGVRQVLHHILYKT